MASVMPIDQPVMLVAGARRGIGLHLVRHYAGRGFRVYGCGRGEAFEFPGYRYLAADVTDEGQVRRLFRSIARESGRLDVLINNAGVASMNHVFLMPGSTARMIFDTHLTGTFIMCREGAKLMRKRRFGRIVNFGSAAIPLRLAGEAAYVSSKAGVGVLSQVLAYELAEFGITVNVVGPSPTQTDLIGEIPKEKIDELLKRFPIGRMTKLADVAHVVDFFVREESSAVTGQIVNLGGAPNV